MKPTPSQPVLIVDTREQSPLAFTSFRCVTGTLTSGDYSISGAEELFAIERKSIPDLVASVTVERERFERELHRLRGYRFARLLIVGTKVEVETHRYRSNASPKSVLHSLSAFEARYNVPVVWCPTPEAAATQVEQWAYWFARELLNVAREIETSSETEPITASPDHQPTP